MCADTGEFMTDEKFRSEEYEARYQTKIFREFPSDDNPYCESRVECYGYDQLSLASNLDFAEYLFLLFRGKLPEKAEANLLNKALIALCSLGVRHPASRAAVAAGVGKTVPENVLPAALMVLNSEQDGAASIQQAMRFLRSASKSRPVIKGLLEENPVFGLHYGSANEYLDMICENLLEDADWNYLSLGRSLIVAARSEGMEIGWLMTGLFAAIFCDLGIRPRFAPGLMQLICAPALVVQGMENANKPTTILPFVTDDYYGFQK